MCFDFARVSQNMHVCVCVCACVCVFVHVHVFATSQGAAKMSVNS